MAPDIRSPRLSHLVILFAALAFMLVVPETNAQQPNLVVRVGDTTAAPGALNTVISVYLTNYRDEVAGFNLWLQLDRPDIMIFQTDIDSVVDTTRWLCNSWDGDSCTDSVFVYGDTLFFLCQEWDQQTWECIDSTLVPADSTWDFFHEAEWDFSHIDTTEVLIGSYDVSGTLIEDWEWVEARSLSGYGTDLNIAGIADLPNPPTISPIQPQQGGVLIKLLADVYDIPDTTTDRTVNIMIQSDYLAHFNFSRPDGSSIGIVTQEVPDTNCWICTAWAGDVCLNWKRVSLPPGGGCDSTSIEMDTVAVLDFDSVWLFDGSLTVDEAVCGDMNGSGAGPDIADLVYLVAYMFTGGPGIEPIWVADVNCSGAGPDITDLVYLVAYMFQQGPWCGCQ
ncbi:MAG TPA: hypothetical protein PLF13_03045 [candidate division Zixibacteria bacterium]|nr:hypothetical protein [candidate division Zixibacteria bacterium]